MNDIESTLIAIDSPLFPGLEKNINIRKKLGDEAIFRQIFIEGELDLRKSKFWEDIKLREEFLGDRALLIDCGAHIGLATLFYGLLFPEAKIISFEPDYNNFLLASSNNVGNKNVTVKNFAVASEPGTLFIENAAEGSAAYRVTNNSTDNQSQGFCSVSINEILYEFKELAPFIIKIDIEGWEKDLFSKNIEWVELFDYIVIELHDWMLPGEEVSRNFWRSLKNYNFDIDSVGEHIIIKTHGGEAIECNSLLDVMEKVYRSNSILTGWYGELQKRPLFKKVEELRSNATKMEKSLKETIDFLSASVEQEKLKVEEQRYNADLVLNSVSWKITRPLRFLNKKIRMISHYIWELEN